MELYFDNSLAIGYKSHSQIARRLTEDWVEHLPGKEFTLQDMYLFTDELQQRHPSNSFVQPKIRQQLQCLRDKGYIEFLGRGSYRKRG